MDTWIGKKIGKCEILAPLGSGSRGVVYKAKHALLDKIVAVKFLQPQILQGVDPQESITRFLQEARACAQLEHPNIITVYDIGEEEGNYYIVMQFVEGKTLLNMIELHGKLSFEWVLVMMKEVAKGLDYAHSKGFIHRDIKPANILVSVQQEIKIADFGTAKEIKEDASLSISGKIYGTPLYMPPEQARGEAVDSRADLYSLGTVMYHALVGTPLYEDPNFITVLQRHISAPIPSLLGLIPSLPEEVDCLFQKLVAKNPANRFASAIEVMEYIAMIENPLVKKSSVASLKKAAPPKTKKEEEIKKTKGLRPTRMITRPKNVESREYLGKLVESDFSDFTKVLAGVDIPIPKEVPLSFETPRSEPSLENKEANSDEKFLLPETALSTPKADPLILDKEEDPAHALTLTDSSFLALQDLETKEPPLLPQAQAESLIDSFLLPQTIEQPKNPSSAPLVAPEKEKKSPSSPHLQFTAENQDTMAQIVFPGEASEVSEKEEKKSGLQFLSSSSESPSIEAKGLSETKPPSLQNKEIRFVKEIPLDLLAPAVVKPEVPPDKEKTPKILSSTTPELPAEKKKGASSPSLPIGNMHKLSETKILRREAEAKAASTASVFTKRHELSITKKKIKNEMEEMQVPKSNSLYQPVDLTSSALSEIPPVIPAAVTEPPQTRTLLTFIQKHAYKISACFVVLAVLLIALAFWFQHNPGENSRVHALLLSIIQQELDNHSFDKARKYLLQHEVQMEAKFFRATLTKIDTAESSFYQKILGARGWFGEEMPPGMERDKQKGRYLWSKDSSLMVYVPAGDFLRGCSHRKKDEAPMNRLGLSAFYLDKYELTRKQYLQFCDATHHSIVSSQGDDLEPMVEISWQDAKKYAEWANKRLPTEAEWEKAARGGIDIPDWSLEGLPIRLKTNPHPMRFHPWGEESPDENKEYRCNYKQWQNADKYEGVAPVGQFPKGDSPYGVSDMAGNVLEWCEDWYQANYYTSSPIQDPKGPTQPKATRVCRGGAFDTVKDQIYCTRRWEYIPKIQYDNLGVRLAK